MRKRPLGNHYNSPRASDGQYRSPRERGAGKCLGFSTQLDIRVSLQHASPSPFIRGKYLQYTRLANLHSTRLANSLSILPASFPRCLCLNLYFWKINRKYYSKLFTFFLIMCAPVHRCKSTYMIMQGLRRGYTVIAAKALYSPVASRAWRGPQAIRSKSP